MSWSTRHIVPDWQFQQVMRRFSCISSSICKWLFSVTEVDGYVTTTWFVIKLCRQEASLPIDAHEQHNCHSQSLVWTSIPHLPKNESPLLVLLYIHYIKLKNVKTEGANSRIGIPLLQMQLKTLSLYSIRIYVPATIIYTTPYLS